jgi:hypothetical protein
MTDQQIWNAIGWLGYLVAAAAAGAWWARGQVTVRETKGLKAENDSLKAQSAAENARRLLAEENQKNAANELATVKAQLVTAQDQLKAHEPVEVIVNTIAKVQSSTTAAIASTDQIGRMLKTDVRLYRGPDIVIKK